MRFSELTVLLPCHSFEDFPTYHKGEEADGLLANWSALWHPRLLDLADAPPNWRRIDDPPQEFERKLLTVPSVSASRLPTGYAQRAKEAGGVLLRKLSDRNAIVSEALAALRAMAADAPETLARLERPLDDDLTADFMALGWAYLQVTLLTRQMRYSASLDETFFKSQATAAARAAIDGDLEMANEKLGACYNLLAEEKDRYYPVDAHIVDLTLVADTTLGESLRDELARGYVVNVMLSGRDLATMAEREPASLDALKRAVFTRKAGLVGGLWREDRHGLLSASTTIASFRRGLDTFERLLNDRPLVFGRRRFGLDPSLPGILRRLGYTGAIHAGFEEGATPEGVQLKVRWEGSDATAIDAIARPPQDAALPETFLGLASKLSQSMDQDHVATVVLAHWPNQSSVWYDDLRRVCRRCAALGRMTTIDRYFAETPESGHLERFEAKQYRSPYLKQAVIRREQDPISSVVRYWRRETAVNALQAITTLAASVTGEPPLETVTFDSEEVAARNDDAIDQRLNDAIDNAARRFAQATIGSTGGTDGALLVNPHSCVRRTSALVEGLSAPPSIAKPVYAAAPSADGKLPVVVDVPAAGFVWIEPGKPPAKPDRPLVEENVLIRNEFFEAKIDPHTGGLFALHDYTSRANRMSQRLALRAPSGQPAPGEVYRDPDDSATYSVMAVDGLETRVSTPVFAEVIARGRLVDTTGAAHAKFSQTFRVWRGSRILRIDVELTPDEDPKADPWNSFYCSRFAWHDEAAELIGVTQQRRHASTGKRIESPLYIEVSSADQATTILTGGLPFHRRQGMRGLDTILITRGESGRRFRFGLGVDLKTPMHDAIDLLFDPIVVPMRGSTPRSGPSGWLAHLDLRNVLAVGWAAVVENGATVGARIQLLECEGRAAEPRLAWLRPLKSARRVDTRTIVGLNGDEPAQDETLTVTEGKAVVPLGPHEFAEIEIRW